MAVKRILLIDDDPGICSVIQIAARWLTNWEIFTAYSGSEGLQQAKAMVPDLILLDLEMPDMDGMSTLINLKSESCLKDIPVILLTAKVSSFSTNNTSEISGVILKPFQALELVEQIHHILNWID